MGPISQEDQAIVDALKSEAVLLKFDPKDFSGSTKNGGVAVDCADGDIDLTDYHRQRISHRPHEIKVFGGSLVFAPSFRGYDPDFTAKLVANLKMGMTVKDTKTLFLYFHAPCGVAAEYKHGIREQIALAIEARDFFSRDGFFVPGKIHVLFHTKRMKDGVLEQNTYKIVV